jgi:cobalt-zinc-cadmium efflux system membrane fusion protein
MNRLALTAVLAALVACRPAPSPAPPKVDGGHGGDAHEAGKVSDLDRPVDELFAATCEHARKTHECDECRYQVGVVRVPAKLLEGGLVKTGTAERRPLETPVPLTGEVRFAERKVTHLSPRAEGVIRKVLVALGE